MPEPGRHRWSPPKRRRPAIPRKTALIVTGIGLLAAVGALAVLGDAPAPDRSGLDTTGAAPVTPLPTVLPSPSTSPSASGAPTPAISATVTPGPRVVAATRTPSSPQTVSSPTTDPRYDTCAQVIAAGLGPYRKGRDIEYGWYPDDDNDGWVCRAGGPERVHYRNCDEARAAGVTPLRRGDPGYGRHLDRDGDGVACE